MRQVIGGHPPRMTFEVEVAVLSEHFGDELVANVLRVMAGANRIASLLHFFDLNAQHAPRDSVAQPRNLGFVALLILAYMHELSDTMAQLMRSGIKRALRDPQPWLDLD